MTAGLYLVGGNGTGKTTLAEAIGRHWIETRMRSARFVVLAHLFELMRRAYAHNETEDLFASIFRVPLLILDDLGAEKPTEWACERLFELINERLQNQRPTVITSNFGIEELEARLSRADAYHGPRIAWRVAELAEGFVVPMQGANLRAR